MPKLSEAELDDAIKNGRVGAITLDTNVFHAFGYDLSQTSLRSVGDLDALNVRTVFSDVVAGEVTKHIGARATADASKLRVALNHYRRTWRRQEPLASLATPIDLEADAAAFAEERWSDYVASVGAAVIEADDFVHVGDLLHRYFESRPPFEDKEGKKHEFPDAIALLSLEAWAREERTIVIAVSNDKGWQSFAEVSKQIVCVMSLGQTLDRFHQAVKAVAEGIVGQIGHTNNLGAAIDAALEWALDDLGFEIEARSDLGWDATPVAAAAQHWDVAGSPLVLAASAVEITFSVPVDVIIAFEATFEWSAYDSIDKDSVYLGSTEETREQTHRINVTITCPSDFDDKDAVEAEASPPRITVDYGYISPDWRYEE